jgi:hypothetical protein
MRINRITPLSFPASIRRTLLRGFLGLLLVASSLGLSAFSTPQLARASSPASDAPGSLPPIRHVSVLVLENEPYPVTFGTASLAPYLAHTLPRQGALLTEYYGIGHSSLDNYIAMISGQAPNPATQSDCKTMSSSSQAAHSMCSVNCLDRAASIRPKCKPSPTSSPAQG